jgi:hypothetical protein
LDHFRSQHPEFRDINVGLMFAASVLPRRLRVDFISEIATFVRHHADELSADNITFWPHCFSGALMRKYLRTLYIRKDRFAEWYSNLMGGYVAKPDDTIDAIVAKKSGKRFRPADELWLAIQCAPRISEMMLDIMGIEDFASVRALNLMCFRECLFLPIPAPTSGDEAEAGDD